MAEKITLQTTVSDMNKFQQIILTIACVILTGTAIYLAVTSPKIVEIDEKHFNCTQTSTKGIEATCTQYTAVSWAR